MRKNRPSAACGFALVAVSLVAAASTGCGKKEEAAPEAPTGTPTAVPRVVEKPLGGGGGAASGGGGGGAAKPEEKPAEAPKELELRVLLRNHFVARGEPIPAMIELINVSKQPLNIVDGRADLAMRTRFIALRGGKDAPAGPGLPAGNSISRTQDVLLAPGEGLSAEVDVLPTFEDSLSYMEGRIHFVLEYQGDAAVAKAGARGWNTDPKKKTRSKQFEVELTLPDWLVQLGGTNASFVDVGNAAAVFQPGVPGAEKTASAMQAKGAQAFGCLLLLTQNLASTDAARSETGRRAFALLRTIGEPAYSALSHAAIGDDPALNMTLGVLLADHDERAGAPPQSDVDKMLRTVGSGEKDGGTFDIRFTATTAVEPGSWTIGADGVLALERGVGEDAKRIFVKLPVDLLVQLKKALNGARFSAWRHCRHIEMADEGTITFALFSGGKEIRRVSLSEQEALRDNPLSGAVLDAFRQITTSPLFPKAK